MIYDNFINQFVISNGIIDTFEKNIFQFFVLSLIVYIILRVILFFSYFIRYCFFKFNVKKIVKIEDAYKGFSMFIKSITKEYIMSVNSKTGVSAERIVNGHINKFKFLFISYYSIGEFLKGFEYVFALFGVAFAFKFEFKAIWIITAFSAVMIVKICDLMFNYNIIKNNLFEDAVFYLNSEIGKFYVLDLESIINGLTSELKSCFQLQTDYLLSNQELLRKSLESYESSLEDVTNKIGDAFANIIKCNIKEAYNEIENNKKIDNDMMLKMENELIEQINSAFKNAVDNNLGNIKSVFDKKE